MTAKHNLVSLLGIPFDDNSSFEKGPAKAPQVVRDVFAGGSLNKSTELGIELAGHSHWEDAGDVAFKPGEFLQPIQATCENLLDAGHRVLSLGGDHSVSYPILLAYAKVFPALTILHVDAHPDLYAEFKGNPLANACPFARIMEDKLCTRLVQVGIRTLNTHQRQQAEKYAVDIIQMKDFHPSSMPRLEGPVYLSLDIDGIDPAFAPGVSHREPGGLSTRDVIQLIHHIEGPLVGADIVEFNPDKDIDGMTAQVVAKLVKEVAGKMLLDLDRDDV